MLYQTINNTTKQKLLLQDFKPNQRLIEGKKEEVIDDNKRTNKGDNKGDNKI